MSLIILAALLTGPQIILDGYLPAGRPVGLFQSVVILLP
jgi:hypothetical protein